jgi:hypothetical protein
MKEIFGIRISTWLVIILLASVITLGVLIF